MDARSKNVCDDLCAIYGVAYENSVSQFNQLSQKFKLPPDSLVWNQIIWALKNRERYNVAANNAMSEFSNNASAVMVNELTEGLQNLQGKFIAMFAAQDYAPASYHFYGHGKEMSQDPGTFAKTILQKSPINPVLEQLTNALGAAHDIIQNLGPHANEVKSAEIFVIETKKMIAGLINKPNSYSKKEIELLTNLRDKTIPFIAEECIVNATYMVFSADKRDFDNILTQIDRTFAAAKSPRTNQDGSPLMLTQTVAAMKLSLALSDTRRAGMTAVLAEQQMLKNIPEALYPALTLLSRCAGILNQTEELPKIGDVSKADKLAEIEAFLLRLGQNVRMTSELAVHFSKDTTRRDLIKDLRVGGDQVVDVTLHLTPFLNSIKGPFGEAAFAEALGKLDASELQELVKYYHLEEMVNDKTFNSSGWAEHAKQLLTMQANVNELAQDDKQKIADIIFTVAAKSPGHKVGPETYDAMQSYRHFLSYIDPKQAEILTANIREIERADPSLRLSPILSHGGASNRQRLISMPAISLPASQDSSLPKRNNQLPPLSYEIKPDRQRSASAAEAEKKDVVLPPINPRKNSR